VTEEHVGGRRWRSTGGWPQQPKEAAGSVLRRLLAVDGGSAAGMAWHRGARERCGVVGASALGAEECGEQGAEKHSESRVEWTAFYGCHGKRRDGFSHGPTARRGDARGDGYMRHAWSRHGGRSAASGQGGSSGRAAVVRA
jgi:hypothetical protein